MNERLCLVTAASCCCLIKFAIAADNWRIAPVPLTTPWATEVDPHNVLPEYPRPTLVRQRWQNLNGVWDFAPAEEDQLLPSDVEEWRTILTPFPWESALSGIREQLPTRTAWYRRNFTIPADWTGSRILLNFGAVDWHARVLVNGRPLGEHRGGYDAWSCDITPALQAGKNELAVWVHDPGTDAGIAVGKQSNIKFTQPEGYSYCPSSGIWQTVWLEPAPALRIESLKLMPDLDHQQVQVFVSSNRQAPEARVEVIVKSAGKEITRGAGAANQPFAIDIPQPKLWSPQSPHLYDVSLTLSAKDGTVDKVVSYFGMRKISLGDAFINGRGPIKRILLNDQPLFQMGTLDQGYWPDGISSAPTDEALTWDIEQTKQCGFNLIRKHIKIEPERWYYHCDRLGMLVWQDMPSTFKTRTVAERAQFENELRAMVQQRGAHPSIVNWIVFNEHWGAYDVERLTNLVMALDPSRLVTGNSGIDAGRPHLDYEVGHICDNHHYRPPASPFPTHRRAIVNGEYGAIGYRLDGHLWDDDGPWVHDAYTDREAATAEYEKFATQLLQLKRDTLLSGAVYTQWTDVENEVNGITSYDRREWKLDPARVRAANAKLVVPPAPAP